MLCNIGAQSVVIGGLFKTQAPRKRGPESLKIRESSPLCGRPRAVVLEASRKGACLYPASRAAVRGSTRAGVTDDPYPFYSTGTTARPPKFLDMLKPVRFNGSCREFLGQRSSQTSSKRVVARPLVEGPHVFTLTW